MDWNVKNDIPMSMGKSSFTSGENKPKPANVPKAKLVYLKNANWPNINTKAPISQRLRKRLSSPAFCICRAAKKFTSVIRANSKNQPPAFL